MTYPVKNELQHRYGKAVLLFCLALMMGLSNWLLITPWATDMDIALSEQTQLQSQIQTTQSSAQQLSLAVEQSGKVFPNLVELQEDYVTQLGNLALDYDLAIEELTADAIISLSESSLTALPITVAVQGDMADIANFLYAMTLDEYIPSVASISYRTEGDYPWMYRTTDDTHPLEWWDISDYTIPAETGDETMPMLTAQDLMTSASDPTCYLSLHLIGMGGG